jgi:hypothetical protein
MTSFPALHTIDDLTPPPSSHTIPGVNEFPSPKLSSPEHRYNAGTTLPEG